MLAALWARIAPYVLAAGAVLATLAAIYGRGKAAGRQAEQARQTAATIKSMEVRREVETDIARGPDGDAARRLRDEWARD